MSAIARQSIQIELNPEEFVGTSKDLLEETFYHAVEQLVEGDEGEVMDFLSSKFFTMRFDETTSGAYAITLTASNKRG